MPKYGAICYRWFMFRLFGLLLLTLPALAISAQAQSYIPAPRATRTASPPAAYQDGLSSPNAWADADEDAEPLLRQAGKQLSQAPSQPSYGHQLDPNPPRTQAAVNAESDVVRPPAAIGQQPAAPAASVPIPPAAAALPPEEQPELGQPKELPANLKKQLVDYPSKEPAGTIIVDTPNTYLYLTLGGGKAIRYGIGVGREGFTWAGTERISKMKEWPDWFPPSEMIERQPYLPRMMAGGAGNPLGARALYLGNTLYRIHGTNQPSTIGTTVSSGCIRLINEDIEDLFSRVQVGSRVVVLPGKAPDTVANNGPPQPANPMAPPASNAAPLPGNGAAISSAPLPAVR